MTNVKRALAGCLSLAVVTVVAQTVMPRGTTNRAYLQQLLDQGMMPRTAQAFVSSLGDEIRSTERDQIVTGLGDCMTAQAQRLKESPEPYLDERANKETPKLLAARLLKACGATP